MFEDARASTLRLFDMAREEAVLHESPGFGFRPIIWHLAHIGVFESYWLLQKLRGENSPDARYERIFDPINTPREASKNLPARREMEGYLARVRDRVRRVLGETRFREDQPLLRDGYVFHLVIEHERQHQETLCYLLQMLDPSKKTRPAARHSREQLESSARATDIHAETAPTDESGMVSVPAGFFEMGAHGAGFVYDNERPAHTVFVPAFKIDRLLTTNEEYARFIAEGGYERREFWSAEGWQWREKEHWTQPLYWSRAGDAEGNADGVWSVQQMFESGGLEPRHPVTGVSWYEAEAYARFIRKRLPTEAEWEKAASWDASRGVRRRYAWGDVEPTATLTSFDLACWGTTPVGSFPAGASAYGCLDMTGNVWEWTNTAFDGFRGFEPFPYPEYSQEWFDGDHRVLKGGSWATGASVLRTSFRNFFRRQFRIGFAGIRCALDD